MQEFGYPSILCWKRAFSHPRRVCLYCTHNSINPVWRHTGACASATGGCIFCGNVGVSAAFPDLESSFCPLKENFFLFLHPLLNTHAHLFIQQPALLFSLHLLSPL